MGRDTGENAQELRRILDLIRMMAIIILGLHFIIAATGHLNYGSYPEVLQIVFYGIYSAPACLIISTGQS